MPLRSSLRSSTAVREIVHRAARRKLILFSHSRQLPDGFLALVVLAELSIGAGQQIISFLESWVVLNRRSKMTDGFGGVMILEQDSTHLALCGPITLIDGQRLAESLFFARLVLFRSQQQR